MRIGITCYPTYGGSGAVATELGLELARRGHEIHFISYASPFRLRGFAERVTFHEVTQLEYPLFEQSSPYALALAVKQHEVAKREQLDLMHVHYAIPHAATAWLAKQMLLHEKLDMKIVTTLHGTDITLVGQDPSYYTLTKFSIEQSDRVTAEHQVDELGLRKDVRFLGKVEDVGDVLRGADLFLLPSAMESFGLAALEAMACAVPVIASAAGGIPEVVEDGKTGFLAPPGDVATMTERALRVLENPAEHERMRRAAAAHALEFSADRVVPRYEAIYEEVLS